MSDVFGPQYASAYDLLYSEKDYEGECDAIEQALARYGSTAVRRVLDIGCGTGGHAIPLARRGYEVVGLDRSESMIAAACSKSARAGLTDRVTFVRGDVTQTVVPAACDAAIMMFAVFSYLTVTDDAVAALRNIRASLPLGALLVFDFWFGPAVRNDPPGPRERNIERGADRVYRTTTSRLDLGNETCSVSFHLRRLRDGIVIDDIVETHTLRYWDREPLARILASVGFELLHVGSFPDFDREPGTAGWSAMGVARVRQPD